MSSTTDDRPEYMAILHTDFDREAAPSKPPRHITSTYKGQEPADWMKDKPAGVFEQPSEAPGKDTWFRGSLDDLLRLRDAEAERAQKAWGDSVKFWVEAMHSHCKEGVEGRVFIVRPEDESKSAAS